MRRKLKRIPAVFETRGLRGRGEVGGLSQKGLFFCTETLPKPGSRVRVVFSDHDGDKIEVLGEVRWNTADVANPEAVGFGVQIGSASDGYWEFYQDLLTS
jgi:hypothetical protein